MKLSKKMLINEIKVLQKAAQIHAKYSIKQYKNVLKALNELENEKKLLEEKVKERTKHLDKLAKYDPLTHLPNRYLFKEQLALTLKSSKLLNKPFTLLFIDLDGFKEINDTYGHNIGDILLQRVSRILLSCVREKTDTVSRLGGDEFTIILPGLNDKRVIDKITDKILQNLNKTINLSPNIKVNISGSIGIYVYNGFEDISIDDIIANADIAMYKAKESGKNRCVIFDQKMKDYVSKQTVLKQELIEAFKNNRFLNYLQPIVNMQDKKIVGVEVLLRYKNRNEILTPAYFIDTLEEMDLIFDVTNWQIKKVLSVFKKIDKDIFISFNLTSKVLNNQNIIDFLKSLKKEVSIDSSRIYFEIRENDFAKDLQKANKILQTISELGFKISLDNFGTGYSSLSFIRDFTIDTLKIDRTFVRDIEKSQKYYKLFQSIINMVELLELEVIIEGIENKEQLELVKEKSFIKVQGFYFYKPMPLEEFILLV